MNKVLSLILFFGLFFVVNSYSTTCITEGCHVDFKKYSVLHDPVKDDGCSNCHEANENNIANHVKNPKSFLDFKYPEGFEPVCKMCHENVTDGTKIHSPVSDGDCIACHNPHGGDDKKLLKSDNEQTLCMQCHDESIVAKQYQHGPVAFQECTVCHSPHSSNYDKLLKEDKRTICYECHEDRKKGMTRKFVHKPLQDNGCIDCHDPHSSNVRNHLKADSEKSLCINCHKDINPDIVNSIKNAKFKHKPVDDGACGQCHTPHSSDYEKLLKTSVSSACYTCHKDIETKVKTSKYIHSPVEGDACATCHLVHGSDNPFILYEYFPEEFYKEYSADNYKLCFECHETKSIAHEKTTDETGFRNGDINLHYLHVVKLNPGRSCKACHEVHAGNQELHIREKVPYGKGGWMLPVKYTRTDNGGECKTGCHRPKKYDRSKPEVN